MIQEQNYLTLDHCTILTVNENNDCIPDGRIVIRGNTIESIGTANDIPEKGTVYNLKNRILMPGLINTHIHHPSFSAG